jgi:5'-3' exonuclease
MHPTVRARSYRDFYYETKLGWPAADRDRTLFRRRAHVRDYLEGLHWNLNYYHNGCVDWNWFFPYFYSPLCTDVVNLNEFYEDGEGDEDGFKSFKFDLGSPFPSLAQLLSVLPPQSSQLLPKPLAELMLEPSSPLTSYYPPDFTTDPNGKRQSWEAVVQIPFIDADLLLDTVNHVLEKDKKSEEPLLSKGERLRNTPGKDHLFVAPRDGTDEEETPIPNGDSSDKPARKNRPVKGSSKVGDVDRKTSTKKTKTKTATKPATKKKTAPKKTTAATVGKSEGDS